MVNWAVRANEEGHSSKMAELIQDEITLGNYGTAANNAVNLMMEGSKEPQTGAYTYVPFKVTMFTARPGSDDTKALKNEVFVLDIDVYNQCPMLCGDAFFFRYPIPQKKSGKRKRNDDGQANKTKTIPMIERCAHTLLKCCFGRMDEEKYNFPL